MALFKNKQVDLDEVKSLEPVTYLEKCKDTSQYLNVNKMFNQWIGISEDNLEVLNRITMLLINSTTLIDDIESDSFYRNGFPMAHTIFGVPLTINAVSYVHVAVLDEIMDTFPGQSVQLARVYFEQMITVHEAVSKEIYWLDTNTCPTEAEYRAMITQKVGGIVKLAVNMMQLLAVEKQHDFGKLIEYLSVYLQIKNDLEEMAQFCNSSDKENFVIERYTFPVIHAVHSDREDVTFLKLLKHKQMNSALKKLIKDRLEKTGSFVATQKALQNLSKKIQEEITAFEDNPILCRFIDNFANIQILV